MKEFSPLFTNIDEFAKNGVPSLEENGEATAPFEHCVEDCDMKSQWVGCHCYSVHCDVMHKCKNTSFCVQGTAV